VTIVMGFDQHREQITWDALDSSTGELRRGRIRPAERESFRHFLSRFEGERIEAALEATTGWRFMVEELRAIGAEVQLAEPAETSALRGPKRRAKTDRADARHLRELLQQGRVPRSWIPPEQILELRSLVRLRRALVEQRTAWQQRIHAQLFHHGQPARRDLLVRERRAWLEGLALPYAARTQVEVALGLVDQINVQLEPLDRELRQIANSWPGTKALQAHYGIGPLTAVAFLAELGDASRFSSSRKAVRYSGLDITVSQSDSKRAPGRLSRQGPATLRWAAYEAAQAARHPRSPDRDYYLQASDRLGGNRACLALARKLVQRAYHTLRELGQEALQPA
jgi:transposase